ncbi:SDR family oxidoreductase [Streptomyces fuscichromogenes]|uniref:Short-chain dehydrogenase/reductase n=1 Tax=Streptomyces fuscichromogenes TaxID=1324013 RepID=A0A918CXM7_9ACTN|nr:SDR family oxidoreductase [Streptomyces fuscichromogenes]GGN46252.1 short-chain dehydrogenase/reductase [Streptomyces fuscichromogenes]
MSKTWFVTGAGRGFGRQFTEAALSRGDKVAATARNLGALEELVTAHGDAVLPLELDVTDKAAVFASVDRAHKHFGRLDVVVNNAGYGLFGAIEELSEEQLRGQMETNVFGAVWVTQAALPHLRAQGSGHIVQISSIGGVAAGPLLGGYHASKWALEGLTESLAQEVAGLGIKVTLVEPGAFETDWIGSSAVRAEALPDYAPVREHLAKLMAESEAGDPVAAGRALLEVVDAENPPLRVFFGTVGNQYLPHIYADRLKTWADWADLSERAQGGKAA